MFFCSPISGMTDTHAWYSPAAHRMDSDFTTVQRLTCCLSLFMTYMLCNIMFYGIEAKSGAEEQSMDLGPTTITWTELRIGVFRVYI